MMNENFLEKSVWINWNHPRVLAQATELKGSLTDEIELIRRVYYFIKDEIRHTVDLPESLQGMPLTAAEVLRDRQGLCYAKAHLFAALLRSYEIPTGLGYLFNGRVLHGFNVIYLKESDRWIRLDAGTTKNNHSADFTLENDRLGYSESQKGVKIFAHRFAKPDHAIVMAYADANEYSDLIEHLPIECEGEVGTERKRRIT